jgi:hypothetical protein
MELHLSKLLLESEVVVSKEGPRTIDLKLTLSDTERLIVQLGRLRAEMNSMVPMSPDLENGFTSVTDPRCGVTVVSETGSTVLSVRDLRYGWLHYVLPLSSAAKLSQALVEQATRAAHPVAGSSAS